MTRKKDSAKAVGHYERAVALRPGVKRAQDMARALKGTSDKQR